MKCAQCFVDIVLIVERLSGRIQGCFRRESNRIEKPLLISHWGHLLFFTATISCKETGRYINLK